MKRYSCALLLLVSSLSFALTPVTINSASINYTNHTVTVVGSGFCTGAVPAVTFNTTRLKVTSTCSSSVVVASLPVQAAASYRLIIANTSGGSATFYVTYGAVGPQGPQGFTGATGATGATGTQGATGAIGPQGPIGLTGATGASGSQGPIGLTGATGALGATGSTGLQGAAGPQGMPGPMGAQGLQGLAGLAGAIGPQGVAGINGNDGAAGPQGPQGLVGPQGVAGTNGTNGTGFNFTGPWSTSQSYNVNDVATFNGTTYIALQSNNGKEPDLSSNTDVFTLTQITGLPPGNNQNVPGTYVWSLPFGTVCSGVPCKLVVNGTFNGTPASFTVVFFDPLVCCGNPYGSLGESIAATQVSIWVNGLNPCCQANSQLAMFGSSTSIYNPASNEPYNSTLVVSPGSYPSVDGQSTFSITSGVTWGVMAQAGTNGTNGVPGINGLPGIQGIPGTPGINGINGTNGTSGTNGTNGTGFNFRGTFDPNASYAVNEVVTFAYTGNNITYNVNLTFGSGSAVGTITTDGTIGVLTPTNIVNWNLTLNDGTKTGVLTPSNTTISGSGLSATATTLLFDYSTWGTQLGFSSSAGVLCFTDYTNCFPGGTGLGTWSVSGDNLYSFANASGVQPIATGGAPATHGTSTYVATGSVAAGTVIPGTSPWVMMAQAGATGTPGINGTNGINGINGLPGAQGPQGLQGAASTVPGPQGPQGNPGTNGTNGLNGTPGPSLAEMRAALLQWYPQTYPAGTNPAAIAFDGSNLWITNYTSNVVTKLRGNDGVIVGTYPTGAWPLGIAFDGVNIWVVNANSNTLTKLQASDGMLVGTYPVGASPSEAVFDGANIWVTNTWSNSVTELRATDGAAIGSYPTGTNPKGITFDGNNIWVSNYGSNNMTELRASDGAVLGTFPLGTGPYGVAFDGLNVWAVNYGDNTVTKLRASDGALVGTYPVGHNPYFMAFDGSNIWVTNGGDNTVTKLRASSGAFLGAYPVGLRPDMVAFDGSNVWVTNDGGGVTRIGATK